MGAKHLWSQDESTFITFFHHSEKEYFGKYLPCWTLRSEVCLLTNWVPMRSILFGIMEICRSLFKSNYLKNQILFSPFFLTFLESSSKFENLGKKKMIVIANVFPKPQTVKDLVKALSWNRRFVTSFDSQQVNGCQHLWNLHERTFIVFFDHFE